MRRAQHHQRGVALVLVMWVAVILGVVAASFILERRTETLIVMNSISMAHAEAAANAGVARAVSETYRNDPSATTAWRRDGTPHDWVFEGVAVRVEMRDESAKIDLNTASEALLRGLLVSSGLADEEANRLLDAILDWRDPDSFKRPNGAEESDYRAAGLSYRPGNAPFQALEELQLVLGMRPEIHRRLSPSLTVYSRQAGVNPQVASREVLLAIPGLTSEIVDEYIARREAARAAGEPLPALAQAGIFAAGMSPVLNVRSVARSENGVVFSREAVALLRPVPRKPVTFVAWRESTAAVPEQKAQ
ncbi:MAG: general secretion pathway protein GspK [Pseudomonadota bacterium]|nr:general secretion pathway protein GspK [Pseudomonadota bacterium]